MRIFVTAAALIVVGVSATLAADSPADPTRFQLDGLVVGGPASVAFLRSLDAGGASRMYRVGDLVGGERLSRIFPDRIVLVGSSGRRNLRLGAVTSPTVAPGPADWLLGRSRLVPRLVEGRTSGFTVEIVDPASLLSQMGIVSGDVVVRVNAMPLDSQERGLAAWQEARRSRVIVIEIDREGGLLTLRYPTAR